MGVLSSLRVLDFSTLLPGPFATLQLADMGADVLRVEAPDRLDLVRQRPPFDDGVSAGHAFLNRSKRSIALDLKKPEAVSVVKRLVKTYDIVLEQFRPGVMDRLGVGYAALAAENPRVIVCSLTGYGQTGPLRNRAGHDNNYLALAGVMSHTGCREHGPVPLGVQIADVGAGSMGAVIGILAAVIHRQQTGEGQHVDISMFDGSVMLNAYAAAACLVGGEAPTYASMPLNGGTHYGFYETADGRYLSVGSLEPKFWEAFCRGIGREDLIAQAGLPGPEMDAVIAEIGAEIRKQTLARWMKIFEPLDCCVEPVLDLNETFAHPQTRARELVVEVPKPSGGTQRQTGSPFKFSASTPQYKHTGADRGEHTETVLKDAGYSDAEIEVLRAAGVFGRP